MANGDANRFKGNFGAHFGGGWKSAKSSTEVRRRFSLLAISSQLQVALHSVLLVKNTLFDVIGLVAMSYKLLMMS